MSAALDHLCATSANRREIITDLLTNICLRLITIGFQETIGHVTTSSKLVGVVTLPKLIALSAVIVMIIMTAIKGLSRIGTWLMSTISMMLGIVVYMMQDREVGLTRLRSMMPVSQNLERTSVERRRI